MASAVDKVFQTTELCEAILENLDMQTLLLSKSLCCSFRTLRRFLTFFAGQRVSKTFKATIDDSLRLQRALWFEPKLPSQIDPDEKSPNPLLYKRQGRLGIRYILDTDGNRCDGTELAPTGTDVIERPWLADRIGSSGRMLVFQPFAQGKSFMIRKSSLEKTLGDFDDDTGEEWRLEGVIEAIGDLVFQHLRKMTLKYGHLPRPDLR